MMPGAHHAPEGGFRNPWPNSGAPQWRDVVRMLSGSWWQDRAPSPKRGTFAVATPAIVHPRARDGDVTATWIGHSTILLQLGARNVITDPVFCQRAFPVQWLGPRRVMDPAITLDQLPPIDVVLLSHNHYDHLDKSAVRHIARAHPNATWIVPLKLGAYIRPWGVRNIIELDWWQETTIGALRVRATPARHMSARRLADRNRTLWCGFALDVAGVRVWFAGDTAYHPEFGDVSAHYGPFDFVMIPIGAYEPRWFMRMVHVNPEESVRIYQDLLAAHPNSPAPLMLAIHWGTFRLTTEAMDEPPRRTAELWREAGLNADRLWVARFGETRTVKPRAPELQVVNNADRHQFEVHLGDHLARLTYRERPGTIDLIHTEVPPALEGRGIAGRLTVAALEYAERQSLVVKPICPYVQSFLRKHPEYAKLTERPKT